MVPNFTQRKLHDKAHTETTSKVTETINSIDYSTGWQYSVSGNNVSNNGQKLNPVSTQNTVTVTPMGGVEGQVTSTQTSADLGNANFTITNPGAAFQFTQTYSGGNDKPDRNPEGNRGYKRNGYYKYLYPVIGLLIASPVNAENVGGISATANPIANSLGSVTNQAIQVLQGPYITNTYGNGISCQGPTLNITPFITRGHSTQDPFERTYFEPQYDMRDFIGRTIQVEKNVKNYPWEPWYDDRTKDDGTRWFEDGADMTITVDEIVGDGVPDNPGEVVWDKPVRTGQQDNISTNIGLSATISFPLDGGLQARCKKGGRY